MSVTVLLYENFKKHCHKKSNCVFLQLSWRKLLKVAAFIIFPTSIMVLFEIHQRFKGHFLNKLHVPLRDVWSSANLKLKKLSFVLSFVFRIVYTEKFFPKMGILGCYFCLQVIQNTTPQWVFRKSLAFKVCKPIKDMKIIWCHKIFRSFLWTLCYND